MKCFYLLILLGIASSCNSQSPKSSSKQAWPVPSFEMPAVPDTLRGREQEEEYLATHYWDRFDFTDTAYLHNSEAVERIVADYLHLLQCVSSQTAVSSLRGMMEKAVAEKRMLVCFAELYEKYLYEPASPFANEAWLIPVLEVVTHSSVPDETDKIRPTYLLEQIRKNRPGTPAADFTFTGADQQTGTLYDTDAGYLLLFFYNPDCHTCRAATEEMAASTFLQEKIDAGEVKVLAVYPENDPEIWQNHRQVFPSTWMNVYDGNGRLQEEELYDFKVFPTLYLLDKTKKVLLKDADFQQAIDFLHSKQLK